MLLSSSHNINLHIKITLVLLSYIEYFQVFNIINKSLPIIQKLDVFKCLIYASQISAALNWREIMYNSW
jgi:hypothetical protein